MNTGQTIGVRERVHQAYLSALASGNTVPAWALELTGALSTDTLTELRDLWKEKGGSRHELEFQTLFALLRDRDYLSRSRSWLRAKGRRNNNLAVTARFGVYARENRQTGLESLISTPTDSLLQRTATEVLSREEPDARNSDQF